VELVRNLEHSRRFLQPRIIGENSESTNLPNQRMEPVSESNRFTFDLLAEYNPPTQEEARAASKMAINQHETAESALPMNVTPSSGTTRRLVSSGPGTGGPR
jgi:type IV pilus assembly protein PilN